MHHAAPGGHPLDVTGLQATGMPGRIPVFEFTRQHIGYRFKATMRMIRRANRLTRQVIHRTHLVDHQDRVYVAHTGRRQRPPDLKTAPFRLAAGLDDLFDRSLHGSPHQTDYRADKSRFSV